MKLKLCQDQVKNYYRGNTLKCTYLIYVYTHTPAMSQLALSPLVNIAFHHCNHFHIHNMMMTVGNLEHNHGLTFQPILCYSNIQ